MLFNSLVFLIFFAVVYGLYRVASHRGQNHLLLVASYVFYGWWDWRFLALIALSTAVDFVSARKIHEGHGSGDAKARKRWLAVSVAFNLGLLGIFKYLDFFIESTVAFLAAFGMSANLSALEIVLPVGISFYTFQTMSYTIDVYRGSLKPTPKFLDFALFVAFFPQLVAGPVERASRLLPQITAPRTVTSEGTSAGVFLVLWGLYKKVVIADNLALIANSVFNNYQDHSGLTLVLATLAFTFQIYCDFSGYSDIARGLCKLMGFELMLNFKLPYFALNPTDFWLRWHVSLSTWLRDYLYISLGGNRGSSLMTYRNLALTMLLGGLWHGSRWTFVIWGAFHGLILVLYRLLERKPCHVDPWGGQFNYGRVVFQWALMFALTTLGWIIFRAETMHQLGYFLTNLGLAPGPGDAIRIKQLLFFVAPLLFIQVIQYRTRNLLAPLHFPRIFRIALYVFLIVMMAGFGIRDGGDFIYFQF